MSGRTDAGPWQGGDTHSQSSSPLPAWSFPPWSETQGTQQTLVRRAQKRLANLQATALCGVKPASETRKALSLFLPEVCQSPRGNIYCPVPRQRPPQGSSFLKRDVIVHTYPRQRQKARHRVRDFTNAIEKTDPLLTLNSDPGTLPLDYRMERKNPQ